MDIFTFKGAAPGPTLVILGRVHGDEPCGTLAINRWMEDARIDAGTVICVPLVNPLAAERDVRFVDDNLNRIMGDFDPATYEGTLVEDLRAVLDRADYLLDLHSYHAGGPPFVFGEEDTLTMAFARSLPAAAVVTGWLAAYQKTYPHLLSAGTGTTEYARRHNCAGVTYECGQHRDPASEQYAYSAIMAALAHTGIIRDTKPVGDAPIHVRLRDIFLKEKEGEHARSWKHLDTIAKGELFAVFNDGSEQRAPEDGVIVLPRPQSDIGVEWGYFGLRI